MSAKLDLSQRVVAIWFQNMRQKTRKRQEKALANQLIDACQMTAENLQLGGLKNHQLSHGHHRNSGVLSKNVSGNDKQDLCQFSENDLKLSTEAKVVLRRMMKVV